MYDLIGKRRWFYLVSLVVTIPGLLFILLTFIPGSKAGLQFSIDYTGGTIWEVHFAQDRPEPDQVRAVLAQQGHPEAQVAISTADDGREFVLIRTAALTLIAPQAPRGESSAGASPGASVAPSPGASTAASSAPAAAPGAPTPSLDAASASPASTAAAVLAGASPAPGDPAAPSPAPIVQGVPTEGEFGRLAAAIQSAFGPIDEVRQQTSVGPVVSGELVQQTFILILIGAVGIMLWITFRFRDFRMGATALVALLHDVLVVVGAFAVLGTLFGLQIDALFVTAMLTVIGFSVHDTIVVFDRIRENKVRHAGEPLEAIVNHSLLQTVGRSINTSLTVVITLSALLLLGGDAIRGFVLALLIGIVSGTFSSIFNASPLYLDWHLWEDRRRARQLAEAAAA